MRDLDRSYYQSPFMERYASDAMLRLLSDDVKFHTWREVWTAVAKLRNHFNLGVSADQLAEMISHLDDPI
ncbi:adenylosuccinate lyase, partial [Patescibacteria group bacterium]|nr:adenylosuccinate lyase [Patescibacteria group bacterium]